MLPFCGYNMADYFGHWLSIGDNADATKLPRLYWVNWFRRDESGGFLWPGFGENSRVLKWVVERLNGDADGVKTPIGVVPTIDGIDTSGLDLDDETMRELVSIDPESWQQELALISDHYATFGEHLPARLAAQLADLEQRLANS